MSAIEVVQDAHSAPAYPEPGVNGQYDLFEATSASTIPARATSARWQEFDDAIEEMGGLRMTDRLKRLAIAPVLLDELTCFRDEWRWPSSIDTEDLLDAKRSPTRGSLISR